MKNSSSTNSRLQNLLVGKTDAKLLDTADCLRVFCTHVGNTESNISHEITLSLFTIFAVKCCQVLLYPRVSFPNSIPGCSVTSDSGITLASLDHSLVTSLHYLFFRLNNYSSVNHPPDMSSLTLIPLQLHDDVTLAIHNLQGNLELANNDQFG